MKKGFTLVELIVVMAILAILVTTAAPKFFGQTKEAQATAVRADAKVIEDASMLYGLDHDDEKAITSTDLTKLRRKAPGFIHGECQCSCCWRCIYSIRS